MRRGLARKHFSAAELLEAHLEQGRRLDALLNAFTVRLDPPRQTRAEGPLAGIPISIKDSLDIEGLPTVCGHAPRLSHRAARNALCVDRLLDAGAVLLGKTNTPEMLMNWETANPVYGPTTNPWALDRTAGGSSGGEAAAISAGLSAGGIGSDGGGSIRLPAALCGICGLKPTPGRIPATGHFPQVGFPGGLLGVIGPMARTVEDLAILFSVVSGHHDSDPFSVPFHCADSPEIETVYSIDHPDTAAAASLFHLSAREFVWSGWQRVFSVWEFFFLRLNAHAIGFPTPHTQAFLSAPPPTSSEILEMFADRDALRSRLLEHLPVGSVLMLPTPGMPAWPLGAFPGVPAMAPLVLANLLGLPSLALPLGLDAQGLPRSIQLVGRPWSEDALLRFGATLEARRGPLPMPPLSQAP